VRFNPPTDDRFGVWRVETVAEPTVPSILESDPFDAPDIPGISATHYEGTGFAIRVPPPCKRLTTGGRPVHLEVDGLTREYRGEMKYVSPVAAIYVTVAGRGIVTGPRIGTVSGGLILADTWDTLHVPERDSYAVTLWCDYPDPDPAKPPVRVSYSATVEHPGR
jgi:hypothetical protein